MYSWIKNNRYYTVSLDADLFGQWVVSQLWGSLNSKRGSHKMESFSTIEDAKQHIASIGKRRSQRGYIIRHILS